MTSNATVVGMVYVCAGGVSNGSYPAPSKGLSAWKWEHIWFVYSLVAMAVLPIGFCSVFAPQILVRLIGSDFMLAGQVFAFGAMWGLGSLLFGVSLPRLGMAITNALVSGVLALFGSLGPLLTGAIRIDATHLIGLIVGLLLLTLSISMCALASLERDRTKGTVSPRLETQRRPVFNVLIALFAGAFSSMLNFGFVVGAPLARNALLDGAPALIATIAIWIPALLGGLILNAGYPAYLIWRRNSWERFVRRPEGARSWLRSSSMGILWFGAILLYGYGASKMGQSGAVYGWALIIAISILVSAIWGVAFGEWNGAGQAPKMLMSFSILLLICSLVTICVCTQQAS
jgi:L-rhamnose-H+ transport protein